MIVQLGNPNIWREPERLSPGVRPVLAAADFSQLPDDPSWEEISELALLIDGYAFTERLPEVAACHDLFFWFNPIWEAHLERNGPLPTSSLHLWLMLFVCQRGYPVFDPVAKAGEAKTDEIFFCTASGADGRGIYTQEGFVVLKGSRARIQNVPSVAGTPMEAFRKKLFETGILVIDGETAVMTKDHLFKSPSYAAIALMARNANGWTDWKTKDGKTLDAVKRQTSAGSTNNTP